MKKLILIGCIATASLAAGSFAYAHPWHTAQPVVPTVPVITVPTVTESAPVTTTPAAVTNPHANHDCYQLNCFGQNPHAGHDCIALNCFGKPTATPSTTQTQPTAAQTTIHHPEPQYAAPQSTRSNHHGSNSRHH